MNIAGNLDRAAYHFPGRTAIIDGKERMDFAAFRESTDRIASALARRGVAPGDHVALCAPNAWRWLAFYYAVLKAGAVAVTFSHLLTAAEIDAVLDDCRPRALFTTEERMAAVEGRGRGRVPGLLVGPGGHVDVDGLVAEGRPGFGAVARDRRDTAAILYTGGTTGIPKGALLSHENLQHAIHNVAHYERSTEADRCLCFLPLNHVFAQVHIVNATVYTAGGVVLQAGFDLEKALEAVARQGVTKFYAVPTVYVRLLSLDDLRDRFASVRYCFSAAASMPAETVREWKARTGLDIHEAYGMTESASMVTYNHYYRHVAGSVGTPANLVEIRIRDEEGRDLPAGRRGEICIRGPNVTRGYLNRPGETAAAFEGEWFRTGDVGLLDDNGYLFVVDRLKDMIITGGENVYPREVEEALYACPDVRECAVVGLPDREYGERVTAFVVPREGREVAPPALKAFLKARLAPFKVPKAFVAVGDLPKNNAGKLLKRELKKTHAATGGNHARKT